jgi:glycosidase
VGPEQAAVAMMLLLTLRGTPTLYQGDELGMPNVAIPPDRVRDPQALREPDTAFNRDEVRTPMPWDASAHAGFSSVEPWLPLNPDWATRNVKAQRDAADSMLAFTRALLRLRRAHPALSVGSWHAVSSNGAVLAYERRHGDDRVLVALNLSDAPQMLTLPAWATTLAPLLTTPRHDLPVEGSPLSLAPNQGILLA